MKYFQNILPMRKKIRATSYQLATKTAPVEHLLKLQCRGVDPQVLASQERQVAASVVQLRRAIGSNVWSNAQPHRRQGDSNRIVEGSSQRVHAMQYAQEDVTLWNPWYNTGWSIKQEEYRPLLYIETHSFRNLLVTSFQKLPETSRTFRTILDHSKSFWILLDCSPTRRSSPNGLIGTCTDGDSPCAAVLARRLIGTCTSPV